MIGVFFVKLLYSGLETLCRMCKTWNGRLCKWLLTIGAFKWATSLQWALKLNALKSSRIIVPFSSKFIEPEYVKRVENNTKKTQKIFDKANVKSGWLKSEEAQQELHILEILYYEAQVLAANSTAENLCLFSSSPPSSLFVPPSSLCPASHLYYSQNKIYLFLGSLMNLSHNTQQWPEDNEIICRRFYRLLSV